MLVVRDKNILKILVLKKSGVGLSSILQDCIDTFIQMGHNVEVFDLDLFKEKPLEREVIKARPDFIFCNNHMGLPPNLLQGLKIPHACWFVDDPFYWVKEDSISPYRVVFVWDRAFVPKLKEFGFELVYPLPLCTNHQTFHNKVGLDGHDLKKYSCDVSFIGGSYYKSFEIIEGFLKKWDDPKIHEITDEIIRLQSENIFLHIYDILETVQETYQYFIPFIDREGMIMFGRILAGAASSIYRGKIVNNLTGFDFRLYGDEGWNDLLGDGKIKPLGLLPYEEASKVYIASKINLDVATPHVMASVGQRPFDILASGGFVLADYCSDIGSLFEVNKEIACFRNGLELKEKIRYFLEYPQEREKIVSMGQKRVLKEHTYRYRMEELVNVMREIFGR